MSRTVSRKSLLSLAGVALIVMASGCKRDEGKAQNWITLVHESYECGVRGEYWKSIELAQKALEFNPRASEAWRLIGNAYELLGDEKEESGDYEQAVKYHRKAAEAWNKAKEINPNIIIPGYHE